MNSNILYIPGLVLKWWRCYFFYKATLAIWIWSIFFSFQNIQLNLPNNKMINKSLFSHFVTIEKAITTKRNDAKRFWNFNRLFLEKISLLDVQQFLRQQLNEAPERYSIPRIVDVNKVCNCLKKSFTSFLIQCFRFARNIIL